MALRPVVLTAAVLAIGCVVAASFDPLSSVAVSSPAKVASKIVPKAAAVGQDDCKGAALLARGDRRPAAARLRARRQGRRQRAHLHERSRSASRPPRASSGPRATTATATSSPPATSAPASRRPVSAAATPTSTSTPGNALYFSDLQGLTNISNSMSTDGGATWSRRTAPARPTRPTTGCGSPAPAAWAGNLACTRTTTSARQPARQAGGNQLVETVSTDGTTLHCRWSNTNVGTTDCAGAAINCVTDNEGISGNQVVDPTTGNVFIAHTTTNGGSGRRSACRSPRARSPQRRRPTAPGRRARTSTPRCARTPRRRASTRAATRPSWPARTSPSSRATRAGYLYVTFTAGPLDHANSTDPNFGALTAARADLRRALAAAGDDGRSVEAHLVEAACASPAPTAASAHGTNTFPWITAGIEGPGRASPGTTPSSHESGTCTSGRHLHLYGASALAKAEWTVQIGESLNANGKSPT